MFIVGKGNALNSNVIIIQFTDYDFRGAELSGEKARINRGRSSFAISCVVNLF
jgi:hypothetical protein